MLRGRFWLQNQDFGVSVGAIGMVFRNLSVPTGPRVPRWGGWGKYHGGEGANISGGVDGGEGANILRGSMGGRVQGVPEFPETGGKYYLLHGGDPPNIMGIQVGDVPDGSQITGFWKLSFRVRRPPVVLL